MKPLEQLVSDGGEDEKVIDAQLTAFAARVVSNQLISEGIKHQVNPEKINIENYIKKVTEEGGKYYNFACGISALMSAAMYLTKDGTEPLTKESFVDMYNFAKANYPSEFVGWMDIKLEKYLIEENNLPMDPEVKQAIVGLKERHFKYFGAANQNTNPCVGISVKELPFLAASAEEPAYYLF